MRSKAAALAWPKRSSQRRVAAPKAGWMGSAVGGKK